MAFAPSGSGSHFSSERLLELLQVDNSSSSRRPREVHHGMAVHVMPQPFNRARLVVYDEAVASEIGVAMGGVERSEFVDALAGKVLFKGRLRLGLALHGLLVSWLIICINNLEFMCLGSLPFASSYGGWSG